MTIHVIHLANQLIHIPIQHNTVDFIIMTYSAILIDTLQSFLIPIYDMITFFFVSENDFKKFLGDY
jgi:hypothetical protein